MPCSNSPRCVCSNHYISFCQARPRTRDAHNLTQVTLLSLGPHAKNLSRMLNGDVKLIHLDEPLSADFVQAKSPDVVISFGYKHIIPERLLKLMGSRAYNVHISMLPWNRGMHPNFWSWLENTPRGVSIHQMSPQLDAGPVVAQMEVSLSPMHTLRSSYQHLQREANELLRSTLSELLWGRPDAIPQSSQGGSFHRADEIYAYWDLLSHGWLTPAVARC